MKGILLFLDYDGTLVPLKKSPGRAVLSPGRKRFLKRLAERMFVCIVSGRSLEEIRKLVGLKGLAYVGNHGLEIYLGRRSWIHPEAAKIQPLLRKALKKIKSRCRDIPGVLVEDKGATGSVHFRLAAPSVRRPLKDILREVVAGKPQCLKITEGKKVLEIRPRLDWDKGKAIQKLCGWLKPGPQSLRIYIGDDKTDEDAFRAFRHPDLTFLVGRRKRSLARHRLASVDHTWKFLKALFQALTQPKKTTV